jgi:hypothetical protein
VGAPAVGGVSGDAHGPLAARPVRSALPQRIQDPARRILEDSRLPGKKPRTDADLRTRLLTFIGDFADWDNSGNRAYLEVARGLVKAAHPEETPLVVDPFAGGGSIPLEALRVGCDAFASDLNPVACLICKVLLEDIPRHGPALAEELRRVGAEVKKAAEKELAEFYPVDPDGARPIAYLWARTVRCEAPNCGAEIPLVRSFWLCKKADRRRALRIRDHGRHGTHGTKTISNSSSVCSVSSVVKFEIFEPATEKDVRGGTVSRAKATCLCCNTVLHPDRVRAQLAAQRGGADVVFDAMGNRTGGATMLAVVTLRNDQSGRSYRLPTDADYLAVWKGQQRLKHVAPTKRDNGLSPIPGETIPRTELRRISMPIYGITHWRDCFTSRQSLALCTVFEKAKQTSAKPEITRLLALALSRLVNALNTICRWHLSRENLEGAYSRQALGMVWDFCEGSLVSESTGSFAGALDWIDAVIGASVSKQPAQVQRADAASSPQVSDAVGVWFTDPPYYDSVPYSHLSDFVYVWLRRLLKNDKRLAFETELTPKDVECVVDRPHSANPKAKDRKYYESKMAAIMAEGRRITTATGIGSVVFAHKTTEGWEALLAGMIRGGWTITGSWPIATEMGERLNARDTASLATSVHLVCRPRPEDAPIGDWGQVLRELPKRVADWMNRLQEEGLRGADLVFACIGPALEIYSRYSKVVDPDEREIPLGGDPEARDPHERGYLAYVWEVVGRTALEQVLGTAEAKARNGAAGALEEDARLTALFLWTIQATTAEQTTEDTEDTETEEEDDEEARNKKRKKGLTLPFDVARRFAQPLGIHLDAWEGRCIETEKGIVRLIPVLDRAEQLFGKEGAEAVAARLEKHRTGPIQATLFPVDDEPPSTPIKGRKRRGEAEVSDESLRKHRGATTLDRVHAAMLLQSSGRANALRALLKSEIERGPDFLRLANALSALYPKDSDEKRLLDAMLLAVPR